MAIKVGAQHLGLLALGTALSVALAGCGSSADSKGDGAGSGEDVGSSAADALGDPNPASGEPVVFGALNLESGPVTFPQVVQAEQAAVKYVNEYLGGIGGRPMKLLTCGTDGSPSTSQRCANQILDKKPVAILGAADTGVPGAIPVWMRANLAYLGGIPFTPVETNSPNSVIFSAVAGPDNAATAAYLAKNGVKSAAVIYTSDTQGTNGGKGIVASLAKAGVDPGSIKQIGIPPTASDVSSAVATAMGSKPDLIFVDAPAQCPGILNSLKQLGNQAKIAGIDPCTSPPAIKGANGGAEGLYFATSVLDLSANTDETALYLAAVKKYAPKDIALDSTAAVGFQTVINVQAKLADFKAADLTTKKILEAIKSGSENTNFMGHPYTCDGKQVPGAAAICNPFQQIRQIKGGKVSVVDKDWFNPAPFIVPAPAPAS